jgi:hypothetical protein
MGRMPVKNRMLMLGGAMLMAFAANGAASAAAATEILSCYGPNGEAAACAADYTNDEAFPGAKQIFHPGVTPPALATGETIVVIGAAPNLGGSLDNADAAARSSRPGVGGEWSPAVETEPLDHLRSWQATYLGGEGLLADLRD